MYVDVSHLRQGGKTYTRYLLRESYRDDGKVKHRTIANLGGCSAAEIEAIRLALRHKDNLSALGTNPSEIVIKQGLSYGAVHVVYEAARSLGIVAALGTTRDGLLACGKSSPASSIRDRGFRPCGWRRLMRPKKSSD